MAAATCDCGRDAVAASEANHKTLMLQFTDPIGNAIVIYLLSNLYVQYTIITKTMMTMMIVVIIKNNRIVKKTLKSRNCLDHQLQTTSLPCEFTTS